jgi:hypothetical protein
MISAISAGQITKNNLNTLSYINEIITGATAQGLNAAFVKQQLLNNEMISILENTYGYKVDIPNNTLNGTYTDYMITWDVPASSGTIVFNGLDPASGGSYVSAPKATITTWLPGTNQFTVEWFQKQTALPSHPRVFSIGKDTTPTFGVSIETNKIYTWPNGNNWAIGKTYLDTWIHVAIVRYSGVTNTYIDGTKVGTGQADTVNIAGATKNLFIGSDGESIGDSFPGKITNFRWSNLALYSGNSFTPITDPLTVLPSTKLLMLGGSPANPVVDSTGINSLSNYNTTWSSDTPFTFG